MLPASRGHTNRQSDRPAAKLIEINIQRLRDSDVMCKYRKTSDRSRARLQAGSRIQAGGGGRRIMGRMHRCASNVRISSTGFNKNVHILSLRYSDRFPVPVTVVR